MAEVQITAEQYADMRGITPTAARKAARLGHKMRGMVRVDKFGKSHRIWVSANFYRENKNKLKKVA